MEEISFLKTYCPRMNRYWGVRLRKQGGEWIATDFYPMTEDEAKVVASKERQDHFNVSPSMTPCVDGGGHTMCCSGHIPCPASGQYSFQCIYCNQLQVRYDSDFTGSQHREGEVIRLSQGQEIRIEKGGKALEAIEVNLGWDPSLRRVDVDSSVILLGGDNHELIFYGKQADEAGSVRHHGDNITGAGTDEVDEKIDILLNKVPAKYTQIAIVINIFRWHLFRQKLRSIRNMFIRLYDKESHDMLCEYTVSHNLGSYRSLIIGVVTRTDSGWTFKASGQGSVASDINTLTNVVHFMHRSGTL